MVGTYWQVCHGDGASPFLQKQKAFLIVSLFRMKPIIMFVINQRDFKRRTK
jgi:hypothetical protein